MTDPTEAVSGLIERIEAGGEGSREMDAKIALAHNPQFAGWIEHPANNGNQYGEVAPSREAFDEWLIYNGEPCLISVPAYTLSIDAAMMLVPAGRRMSVQQRRSHEPFWVSFMIDGGTDYDATGRAKTLALAITAAALRARETTPSIKGGDRG